MESNRDWKAPVALVLAGLALFVALSGRASSHAPEGWPRFLGREPESFVAPAVPSQPFKSLPPMEPTVPAPGIEPEPFSEMPPFKGEMFDKWGEWRGPELQPGPELRMPNPPNVELRIRNEQQMHSWHGLGDYMLALFETWFAPLAQLVQPLAILLLAWIVIRQARRRNPAVASRDDITTPEGAQNGQ